MGALMPINEFFDEVGKARKRTKTVESGAWYRGISDGRHKLVPSLLRYRNRHEHAEINIFSDFWTMIDGVDLADSWQRLSFMQHYGVPTRLLDWTTDLNVATYFALANSERKGTGDPCIWVLNPFKLNELYKGTRVIYDAVDLIDFDYRTSSLAGRFPNKMPLALRPTWSNSRIRLQSGCFTFHGTDCPLEDLVRTNIASRVHVPHSSVYAIRNKLRDEGVNSLRIFGGPEGLSTYLRRTYLGI